MTTSPDFLQDVQQRILVADGAFGTLLHEKGVPLTECYDNLNLNKPEIVAHIHREYVNAGAEVIETNTFGANRWKLRHYELTANVRDINVRGAEIALQCAQDNNALVVGSIGPLGRMERESLCDAEKEDIFREQAQALIDGGVPVIILETFPTLADLLAALRAVKSIKNIPTIAQLVFTSSGRTGDGHDALSAFLMLQQAGADVVGANCGIGPNGILKVLKQAAAQLAVPVSAFPNAGFPERRDDRMIYMMGQDYLTDIATELVTSGVNLIGGCCGTGPAEIRAIKAAVSGLQSAVKQPIDAQTHLRLHAQPIQVSGNPAAQSRLQTILSQRKVISVELDPPKTLRFENVLDGAHALKNAGADVISIAENPLAVVRMSNVSMARLIQQRIGIETLVHITGRDRNLIGMQSELMGMAVEGLHNVLAITGDPPSKGKEEKVKGVFDLRSFELISLLNKLNQGQNYYGDDLKKPTSFTIGAAFNPNVTRMDVQVRRMHQKIENGAKFFQTQPVYSRAKVDEILELTRDMNIPIFLGILPLVSSRNAEFLHNEFPGISIPDDIRARMRAVKDTAPAVKAAVPAMKVTAPAMKDTAPAVKDASIQEGIDIAWELIEYAYPHFAGVYIMPPFNKYQIAVELIRRMRRMF